VAAEELRVDIDVVDVVAGDTSRGPYSLGTLASRTAVVTGSATRNASQALARKLLESAAGRSTYCADELVPDNGRIIYPDGESVPFDEIVRRVTEPDTDGILSAEGMYHADAQGTFGGACHGVAVEVDAHTGKTSIRRYVVAEDCGQMLNPTIVEGQIAGGVAQGIGSALYERSVYDDSGQPVTSTLMDYPLPSTMEVPNVEVYHVETVGKGPAGAKGVGEGGAIGPMAAVANAVADAVGSELASLVTHMPLTPSRLWEIIHREERTHEQ
jgi:carbon-monoxide dehydrogenase large subunit